MKDEIQKMGHGESYVVPESDYGKAEIFKLYDRYIVFGIPQYGGPPWYHEVYSERRIDGMIEDINSWT